jgi:hypothetical protein
MDELLAALKDNRHGHRDWLIGLVIYRHARNSSMIFPCFRRTRRVLASLGTLLRFILFSVYTIS